MEQEKADAEVRYRLAKMVVVDLFHQGLINEEERNLLIVTFIDKFKPMVGELERGEYFEPYI